MTQLEPVVEPVADVADVAPIVESAEPAMNAWSLALDSSGVVLLVLIVLIIAAGAVWVIWAAKALQLKRLREAHQAFENTVANGVSADELVQLAEANAKETPGARVVLSVVQQARKQEMLNRELLSAAAKRAIQSEEQNASALMPSLSSIAAASPFVGLFGTVWGIMNAFLAIGAEKSASLPVVAPAIGEALIATAFGLLAAIPATIAYNFLDRRIGDLLMELETSSDVWVELLAGDARQGIPSPAGGRAASQQPAAAYAE
jgi:biopolymer transport protein TolQ